jgi:hypothetical protein
MVLPAYLGADRFSALSRVIPPSVRDDTIEIFREAVSLPDVDISAKSAGSCQQDAI